MFRLMLLRAWAWKASWVGFWIDSFFAVPHQRVAGHGDNTGPFLDGPFFTNATSSFEAVHFRHLNVEKENIVGFLLECFEHFDAIMCDVGTVAEFVEDAEAYFLV